MNKSVWGTRAPSGDSAFVRASAVPEAWPLGPDLGLGLGLGEPKTGR